MVEQGIHPKDSTLFESASGGKTMGDHHQRHCQLYAKNSYRSMVQLAYPRCTVRA